MRPIPGRRKPLIVQAWERESVLIVAAGIVFALVAILLLIEAVLK